MAHNPLRSTLPLDDPYPVYAEWLADAPVHWNEEAGFWIIAGYEPVKRALYDFEHFSRATTKKHQRHGRAMGALQELHLDFLIEIDPPSHTRLRRLVNLAFTPRRIAMLRARVEAVVDELLVAAMEQGPVFDLVEQVAFPLPSIVIAELLGVPAEDRFQFNGWADALANVQEPRPDVETIAEGDRAARESVEYFGALVAERAAKPREDLISAMVQARDEGDVLSHNELVANLLFLLSAGHETTINLISNCCYAFAHQPDQLRLLHDDHDLAPSAVEEILRYDAPVQLTGRIVMDDFEYEGQHLRAGQSAILMIGAANRDPGKFDQPGRFDVTRNPNAHIGFGFGVHHCLGAPLARLEGEVALREIARRMPTIELAGAPVRRDLFTLRGFEKLPIAVGQLTEQGV
jgi:cytochrome P450